MDKGMKGLLSGDLSSLAIKEIQRIIEKGLPQMEKVQSKISRHLEQRKTEMDLDEYIEERMAINAES